MKKQVQRTTKTVGVADPTEVISYVVRGNLPFNGPWYELKLSEFQQIVSGSFIYKTIEGEIINGRTLDEFVANLIFDGLEAEHELKEIERRENDPTGEFAAADRKMGDATP